MLPSLRIRPALSVFTLGYPVGFGIYALIAPEARYLIYGPTLAVLIAVVVFADQRVGFSSGVLWGLSFWGLVHLAGGLLPSLERAGATVCRKAQA